MTRFGTSCLLLAAAWSAVLPGRPAFATPLYHVTDLGALGTDGSEAFAINASGQVAGISAVTGSFTASHGFIYTGGHMVDLNPLSTSQINAFRLNDLGQVVGLSDNQAFVYSGGVMTLLGGTVGTYSEAYGINNSGQIVGWNSPTQYGATTAFLDSGGVVTHLLPFAAGESMAFGINNAGQVVGSAAAGALNSVEVDHAFLYSGGVMTDLGTLPGALTSGASGINSSGQVVGTSTTYTNWPLPGTPEAFIDSGGVMTGLGTLGGTSSIGYGINDLGQVVGRSTTASSAQHGYLYSNGAMTDLNTTLDGSGAGWTLTNALGINDNGWITGYGTNPSGHVDAFLLTPDATPEPSSAVLCLLALGGGGLYRWKCRRRRQGSAALEARR